MTKELNPFAPPQKPIPAKPSPLTNEAELDRHPSHALRLRTLAAGAFFSTVAGVLIAIPILPGWALSTSFLAWGLPISSPEWTALVLVISTVLALSAWTTFVHRLVRRLLPYVLPNTPLSSLALASGSVVGLAVSLCLATTVFRYPGSIYRHARMWTTAIVLSFIGAALAQVAVSWYRSRDPSDRLFG